MARKPVAPSNLQRGNDIVTKAAKQGVRVGHALGRPEDGIGQRIRDAREKRNWSQESLSRLTKHSDPEGKGISRSVLAYYEKGRFKPGARELRLLYAALGVTPNWLVLGESDPERLREFRLRFKSDKDFYAALLDALRKLDSDSLNGVAALVLSASINVQELKKWQDKVSRMTYGLLDETAKRLDEVKRMGRRLNSSKTRPATKS